MKSEAACTFLPGIFTCEVLTCQVSSPSAPSLPCYEEMQASPQAGAVGEGLRPCQERQVPRRSQKAQTSGD